MTEEGFKILTPSEAQKLPACKYDYFGSCEAKDPKAERCLKCCLEGAFKSLIHENPELAMHHLDCLIYVLKDAKVIT
jgi:hypothetical protein